MSTLFTLFALLLTPPALADIAFEEPDEKPAEDTSANSSDEESSGCSSSGMTDLDTMTLPLICLGGLALLRREQNI